MNDQLKITIKYLIIIFIAIVLLVLSIIFMLTNKKPRDVIVNVNGVEIKEVDGEIIDINVDRVFTIFTNEQKTEYNTFEIKDKAIKCIDSNCEDQVCKKFGSIDGSHDADVIICAPHRVVVYFSK